ncbi:MAG: hypothetical protein ACFFDH_20995 [Promethearchaeota archaeon]
MTEIHINKLDKITSNASKKDPFKFVNESKKSPSTQKINYPKSQLGSKIYRQGDILFRKIDTLPTGLKEKPDKVVAEGEETGHAHILVNGAVFELLNSESLYIQSGQETRIIHDEHLPIKLEAGNYQVIRQREYLGPGLKAQIVRD